MQTHRIVQKDIHRNNISMNDRVTPNSLRSSPRIKDKCGNSKTETKFASSNSSKEK